MQGNLFYGDRDLKIRRRVSMRVADAGEGCIRFTCRACGHDTGWITDDRTVSENKRGRPCPCCNPAQEADRHG